MLKTEDLNLMKDENTIFLGALYKLTEKVTDVKKQNLRKIYLNGTEMSSDD